ncbi:MAG: ankyrin repeat domain-containing protein [Cyanobacteria bacterium]|nr:ankyrin repeat domain-containing protein [Cyanobacteriota bacterium]
MNSRPSPEKPVPFGKPSLSLFFKALISTRETEESLEKLIQSLGLQEGNPAVQDQSELKIKILYDAVQLDSGKNLKALLDLGVHPNTTVPKKNNQPILHLAIYHQAFNCIKILLNHGVDLTPLNHEGKTPLHIAEESNNVDLLKLIYEKTPEAINQKDTKGYTPIQWAFIKRQLPNIKFLMEQIPSSQSKEIIATQNLMYFATTLRNLEIYQRLLNKGGSLHQTDSLGKSVAHWAGEGMLPFIIQSGVSINVQDDEGKTPLMQAFEDRNTEKASELIKAGANPFLKDKYGRTAADVAAMEGFSGFAKSLTGLTPYGQFFLDWGQAHMGPEHFYPISDPNNPKHQTLLTQLNYFLPRMLFQERAKHLHGMMDRIEHQADTFPSLRKHHPFEAELLLLLNHPDLKNKEEGVIRAFTTGLTSLTQFFATNVPLTDTALKAWTDIGQLTHSFRYWKWDTKSIPLPNGKNNLLEDFGFNSFPENRDNNEIFGKGFWYNIPNTKTLVEFRRGYLLISDPENGTLIIRNSSSTFGRNLLKHPGYWLPRSYNLAEITRFNPQRLFSSDSILHKYHYMKAGNDKKIETLTSQLKALKEEYRRYKLDTEAFEDYHQNKHFTGHLSPGFLKIISMLNTLKEQGKPLPDLAFVHPDYPIFEPFSFTEDARGNKINRYQLTPSAMDELNDFSTGHWNEKKYPHSTLIQFLHLGGVENRGELVLLDPEQ